MVAASVSLVALALVLSVWFRLRLERQVVSASIRAAVQLIAVGLLFGTIFESGRAMWWAWCWVAVMVVVATVVVVRRARQRVPGLVPVAALAVASTAAVSLAVTLGFGVVDHDPVSVVVIAGITIGNAVPAAALGANQAVALGRDRFGELEALLSLGFDRRQVVRTLAPRVARTALLPQLERTRVVGLIALPGAMTGLLLAGVDPFRAVLIQLVVMYLVLGTTAVCVTLTVATITRAAMTPDLSTAVWVRPGSGSSPDGG